MKRQHALARRTRRWMVYLILSKNLERCELGTSGPTSVKRPVRLRTDAYPIWNTRPSIDLDPEPSRKWLSVG